MFGLETGPRNGWAERNEMTVYKIAKWESVFERAESRKLKQLTWVAMPIGFDSTGYQLLLDEFGDDAAAIYGAWCVLCAVAASCHRRGVLASSRGIPLKVSHIARMTGFQSQLFERLIAWASSPEVCWLEVVDDQEVASFTEEIHDFPKELSISGDSPDVTPTLRGNPPDTQHHPTEQNKTRHNPTSPNITSPDTGRPDWDEVWRMRLGDKDFCSRVGVVANRFARLKCSSLDRDLIFQASWIGVEFDRDTVDDLVDRLKDRGEKRVEKPKQYLASVMRKLCSAHGETWDALRKRVPPAPPPPKHKTVEEALQEVQA
jgi:hypothetical protein